MPAVCVAGLTLLVIFFPSVLVTPFFVVASRMSFPVAYLLVACVFLCFTSGLYDAF